MANPASQSTADQQWASPPGGGGNAQNPASQFQNRSAASQNALPQAPLTNDLSSRNNIYQAYASQASLNQLNSSWNSQFGVEKGIEGMSRPIWIGDELLLARRVRRGEALIVQGCWIDWDALSARLLLEVFDLVPDAELRAADAVDLAFNGARDTLATLPVELVTPAVAALPSISPPTRVALLLAWAGLLVAASAAGFTLYSVLALSERRAAFVAAVTHELRTPLTTFRMYAEMLAGGMVPGERQPEYLSTLSVEADRLAHLVDNVLQYARLERGRPRVARETLQVTTLVERLAPRLAARAQQAGLAFETRIAASLDGVSLTTDVSAVDQILFNLVDNACKYA
ncbi:MAG TPA: HAMP domain-containing sensor histidine kinase, partial [Pirellulaceae bacterium]|nr:HAMP domain-containing sensor histidine kinase [Pirellulaceae bacterium]